MNDWIPEVAVITPERQIILDLIKLCKREMAYHQSAILALQVLANTGHSALANQFADQIEALSAATVRRDVEVLFRQPVSALMHGQEYLQSLRDVLSKQL